MIIPKGQRVRIRKYDASTAVYTARSRGAYNLAKVRDISKQQQISGINDTSFILMEPFTFNVSSQFTSLIKTEQPSLLQYITGDITAKLLGWNEAAGVITGVTEYSGFQRWSSTEPIDTEVSLGLVSKGDAYNDVVKPMLNLIKLTIPSVNHSDIGVVEKARTLRLPGPSVIKTIQSIFNKSVNETTSYTESDTEFTICIGNLVFDHVVITNVTPTIMPDTDEFGYPLSVFLKLRFKGTRIPNDEMMDDIFAGWEE